MPEWLVAEPRIASTTGEAMSFAARPPQYLVKGRDIR
jgi:hypothetical protein